MCLCVCVCVCSCPLLCAPAPCCVLLPPAPAPCSCLLLLPPAPASCSCILLLPLLLLAVLPLPLHGAGMDIAVELMKQVELLTGNLTGPDLEKMTEGALVVGGRGGRG